MLLARAWGHWVCVNARDGVHDRLMDNRKNWPVGHTRVAPRVLLATLAPLNVAVALDALAPVWRAQRAFVIAPPGAQESRRAHEERHTNDESLLHVSPFPFEPTSTG